MLPPSSLTIPRHLYRLSLDHNNLTQLTLPVRIYIQSFPILRYLSLSKNSWLCECDEHRARWKDWLVYEMADRLTDVQSIECVSLKRNIECLEYFESRLEYYRNLSRDTWISGLVMLTVAIIMLSCIRFRKNVKVYAVALVPGLRSFRPDIAGLYDAFIAYNYTHHETCTWATSQLVPRLESNNWNYKLILIERDSRPGTCHSSAIHAAVHNSKCLILVVDSTYASNPWLYLTLREAEYLKATHPRFRVIIILFGINAEQAKAMDQLLAEYIETNHSLVAEQRLFWRKLFYLMPSQSTRHSSGDSSEENVEMELIDEHFLRLHEQ